MPSSIYSPINSFMGSLAPQSHAPFFVLAMHSLMVAVPAERSSIQADIQCTYHLNMPSWLFLLQPLAFRIKFPSFKGC
nr:hypothetical protein Q903MT_gene4488 [Picea sitchensis]